MFSHVMAPLAQGGHLLPTARTRKGIHRKMPEHDPLAPQSPCPRYQDPAQAQIEYETNAK